MELRHPNRIDRYALLVHRGAVYVYWLKFLELIRLGRRCAGTSLSRTLETLDRLEMGL